MSRRVFFAVAVAVLLASPAAWGQEAVPAPQEEFLHFIKAQAARLRGKDLPPQTRKEWEEQRGRLKGHLRAAWGPWPEKPCPLEPRVLGTLQRDGYRVEKLVFQTMPGVWMTANTYVPDGEGKRAALLMVHGHWRGARVDPAVQKRCIGAAKLGYFVLAVDAFGAGERANGKKLGEYHGEMVAATLLPAGLPLSGLQVYENMRAVDYLLTRPEVDGTRLGITGASGGGNQTMYAGSWDDRFKAAVPVCSVGNYQAYLGTACCMCEVVPGALRFTEEWGVLGNTAPRGLLVINATKDGIQFSVGEAKKSLAKASEVYRLYDRPGAIRHTIIDSGHDYNQPMREAMYGWMARHLKNEGQGDPIAEPELKTEDPEALRCFPGESRPDNWMTLPRFAAAEGRKALARLTGDASPAQAEGKLLDLLGGRPEKTDLGLKVAPAADGSGRTLTFHPEPGLPLTARQLFGKDKASGVAVLLDLDGADQAAASPTAKALKETGWSVITLDLRATGKLAWPRDKVGRAPDHNTAEWSLWIGRPLLGQWAWDVSRLLDALAEADGVAPKQVAVVGKGPAGLVALCAGATDKRITRTAALDSLASYVSDVPYQGQRLGVIVPGILRGVGDVAHLASLCAPRRVVIAGGVWGGGEPLTAVQRLQVFAPATRTWQMHKAPEQLQLMASTDVAQVVQAILRDVRD